MYHLITNYNCSYYILLSVQHIQDAQEKNDTVIQFKSPTVNNSLYHHCKTYIKLDNWEKELKPFDYHPDPTFNELTKKTFTETGIIIVTVSTEKSLCEGIKTNGAFM